MGCTIFGTFPVVWYSLLGMTSNAPQMDDYWDGLLLALPHYYRLLCMASLMTETGWVSTQRVSKHASSRVCHQMRFPFHQFCVNPEDWIGQHHLSIKISNLWWFDIVGKWAKLNHSMCHTPKRSHCVFGRCPPLFRPSGTILFLCRHFKDFFFRFAPCRCLQVASDSHIEKMPIGCNKQAAEPWSSGRIFFSWHV